MHRIGVGWERRPCDALRETALRGGRRRRVRAASAWATLCLFFPEPAGAQDVLPITSRSAVLMDARSGRVLYEKNAHEPLPPASVTKVFTLVAALEALRDGRVALDDLVTTSRRAAGMGGTQVYLEVGEMMTLEDLLYAIAVESANDAAVAVAEHISGTEEAFAALMNERSRALGALNTEFSNASGLPPGGSGNTPAAATSRRPMTSRSISRYGYTLPMFEQLVSTYGPYRVRVGTRDEREFWSRNTLLRFYQGANGVKTGFTTEAGYCLAASAVRDDLHLIAVVLGAPSIQDRDEDIRALLNWGFRQYEAQEVVDAGEPLSRLYVAKGAVDSVDIVAADDLHVTVPRGAEVRPARRLVLPDRLLAPLDAGQVVGQVVIMIDGEEAGRVDAVAQAAVPRGSAWVIVSRTVGRLLAGFVAIQTFR